MSTKKPPTLPSNTRPPLEAVAELAVWAFALAEESIADWPEGKRRVDVVRRHLTARLRGQSVSAPCEDIEFTASLLARILEADHGLGTSEIVAILDQLDLPTDVVPIVPREPPPAAAASVEPFRRSRWKSRAPYPEPVCADRPEKRFRNAA
jgi:hypothetical protein